MNFTGKLLTESWTTNSYRATTSLQRKFLQEQDTGVRFAAEAERTTAMKIADWLYDLAFQYKKTKLWTKLYDMDLFAVKLSDGEIGYISVMGKDGKVCSLALYLGDAGFRSFSRVASISPQTDDLFVFHETMMSQECIQCGLEERALLDEEEYEEVKAYADTHGIRLTGKNAYPQFRRFERNCYPWQLQTEQDQKRMGEALAAAIACSGRLGQKKLSAREMRNRAEIEEQIPLFIPQEEQFACEWMKLPELHPERIPQPVEMNDVSLARLKKCKKIPELECELIRLPKAAQAEEGKAPRFPILLAAVNPKVHKMLPMEGFMDYENRPEEYLDQFIRMLSEQNICPKKIQVQDERTHAFLEAFCARAGIQLQEKVYLDDLEEMKDDMWDFLMGEGEPVDDFDEDEESEQDDLEELQHLIEMLSQAEEQDLKELPPHVPMVLEMVAQQKILSEPLQEKLEALIEKIQAANSKKQTRKTAKKKQKKNAPRSQHSYVISVSIETGCYRHIQIGASSTLVELHRAILDSIDFMDDHGHAFFMDNQAWSYWDSYWAFDMDEDEQQRCTADYTLEEAGLCEGKKFKYLFDLGDEWMFQCRVLKELSGDTPEPVIVRSKGTALEQYGGWGYDWDDED